MTKLTTRVNRLFGAMPDTLVKPNYKCCQRCAWRALRKNACGTRIVFYSKSGAEHNPLPIHYTVLGDTAATIGLAQELCERAPEFGLRAMWDRNTASAILLEPLDIAE